MEQEARVILGQLVSTHGPDLTHSPELFEGLLMMVLSPYPRELNVLLAALHEDLPAALAAAPKITPGVILRLAKQLEDCQLLKTEAAQWAVESWAEAIRPGANADTPSPARQSAPARVERLLKSRMAIEVLARPEDKPAEPFKTWGSTPGTVPLPGEYAYIFKKMALHDDGLDKLAADLARVGLIYGIDLSSGRFTASALTLFLSRPFLRGLRSLYLGGSTSATDGVLEAIGRLFPNLEELNPGTRCYITDEGLLYLENLSHLRKLSLSYCSKITSSGLAHLRPLDLLETLELDHTGAIGDEGLVHLQDLLRLKSLDLSNCSRISEAGLALLGHFIALQSLKLNWNTRIGDAGLEGLRPLDGLTRLSLVKCTSISSQGLRHLDGLHSLEELDLAWMEQITDTGLAPLANLSALHRLSLYHCERITDEGLRYLSRLGALRTLDLAGLEQITDAGLAHLAHLSALEDLTLDGREISGKGLQRLIDALPGLHRLHVWSANQITTSQAASLRRPGMDVWIRGTY